MKSVHRSFLLGKLTKSDVNGVNRPAYCLDVTLLTYGCRTLPACPGHASATRSIPTMLSLRSNTSLSAIVISDTGRSMDESRSTTDSRKEQRCSSKVQQLVHASRVSTSRERDREREGERYVIFIVAKRIFCTRSAAGWSTAESSSVEGSRQKFIDLFYFLRSSRPTLGWSLLVDWEWFRIKPVGLETADVPSFSTSRRRLLQYRWRASF